MNLLNDIAKKIQAKTTVAPVTALTCIVVYTDASVDQANVSVGPTENQIAVADTYIDIIPAPADKQSRCVTYISIYNPNTATHNISVSVLTGGTNYIIFKAQLKTTERAEYNFNFGWAIYDKYGVKKKDKNITETANAATNVSVGVASTAIVAANTSRKGLVIQNSGSFDIFLGINTAAVLDKGIFLIKNGGTWVMDEFTFTTESVEGIVASNTTNITVQEFQ